MTPSEEIDWLREQFNSLSLKTAGIQRSKDSIEKELKMATSIIHQIKDEVLRNGPIDYEGINDIIDAEVNG